MHCAMAALAGSARAEEPVLRADSSDWVNGGHSFKAAMRLARAGESPPASMVRSTGEIICKGDWVVS